MVVKMVKFLLVRKMKLSPYHWPRRTLIRPPCQGYLVMEGTRVRRTSRDAAPHLVACTRDFRAGQRRSGAFPEIHLPVTVRGTWDSGMVRGRRQMRGMERLAMKEGILFGSGEKREVQNKAVPEKNTKDAKVTCRYSHYPCRRHSIPDVAVE